MEPEVDAPLTFLHYALEAAKDHYSDVLKQVRFIYARLTVLTFLITTRARRYFLHSGQWHTWDLR